MAQENANNVANLTHNLKNDDPPLLEDVNLLPQGQQATANAWNPYRLDPMEVDITEVIMLPPLP